MSGPAPIPAIDRAMGRLTLDEHGCWLWEGTTVAGGYGHLSVGRVRRRYVHAVTFEHFRGPVPEGLELDHLCRVRGCANPWHLEAVTHAENVRRGLAGQSRCHHADAEKYRRKSTGAIAYCRACRRDRRAT